MGDIGATSDPDINSQHWNTAKYGFIEGKGGFAINYTSWNRDVISGINLGYVSGYYKINDKNTVSTSLRFFSFGTIEFTSIYGNPLYEIQPYELAVDGAYTRRITENLSAGVVIRYIHSDLTGGKQTVGGQDTKPGQSIAGDLGLYYQDNFLVGERNTEWAVGLNISNIGTPISYTVDADKTPIPTNLRLGGRLSYDINQNNTISFNVDLNKLMVPSPPVFDQDSATGDMILIRGKEAPESVILGMFQSFYDAPGMLKSDGTYSVAAEDFNEINFGLGLEYWYNKQFALRTGYFYQHESKGNQKYFTFGIGAKYKFLTLDISYLLPTYKDSWLQNTFRVSLLANF